MYSVTVKRGPLQPLIPALVDELLRPSAALHGEVGVMPIWPGLLGTYFVWWLLCLGLIGTVLSGAHVVDWGSIRGPGDPLL